MMLVLCNETTLCFNCLALLTCIHTETKEMALRIAVIGYLVDIIVHLAGHFLELLISHGEVFLVRVEVSVLPVTLSLSVIHVGQIKCCLQGLNGKYEK